WSKKHREAYRATIEARRKAKAGLPVPVPVQVLKPGEIPLDLVPERPQPQKQKGPWKQGKSLNEEQARLILAAETVKLISQILDSKKG
ncbi:MAG TPA: hypothetical protein VJQ25_12710, partial [Nitrospira sp.]|nr:hypothetical protein [Nitrospira sp.]